jgi:tetratricopeptide (TPR) repeat protein
MKKPEIINWKSQPIFISSTFTDMMAERDVLRDFVFPELEERLRERKIRLEAIDLRWGVETSNEKEQEAKELLVLKVCLDEIDRSLPFFIGIIGDRYGWVPPQDRLLKAEKEKGFRSEINDKSVTALEIEYGVLADREQLKRSFFFFRESLPFNKIPDDIKAKYADIHIDGIDKDYAEKRLENFKKIIEYKVGKDKVFTYKVDWDAENNKVIGLDDFKQKVLDLLWKEIDEQTKNEEDTRPKTWQDEERVYLDEFVEDRTISFSGRENIINELKTFAQAESDFDNWGLCLSGESGGGKSALFAKVFKELKSESNMLVLAHAAGISLRSNSLENMLTLWIGELGIELQQDVSEQLSAAAKFEELKSLFSELLSQVAINKRVVILVDALNEFENTNQAKYVNWLPEIAPDNVKFIFTAIAGEETENLKKRKGLILEELAPISNTGAKDIISIICNKYHKELNQQVINRLLDKKKKDGTFAYNNALWLTMAIDEFLLLDEDDFNRMKSLEGDAEQKLLQLLLNTADELPADISGMYNYVFERAGLFGKEFANSILSYVGISRSGLRESDLKKLIANYTIAKWEPLNFAAFRRYLRSHLVRKGEMGLWDFRHTQMRKSLKRKLTEDPEKLKGLHNYLAEHLDKLPQEDPLRLTEIMWHLFKCNDNSKAAELYGSNGFDNFITYSYSNTLKDIIIENEDNFYWILSFLSSDNLSNDSRVTILNNILHSLEGIINSIIEVKPILNFLLKVRDVVISLVKNDPDNQEYLQILSFCSTRIGEYYVALGDSELAINSIESSIKIAEELIVIYPEADRYKTDLFTNLNRLGDIYLSLSELETALTYYEKANRIIEKVAVFNSNSEFNAQIMSVQQSKLGDVYKQLGKLEKALSYYKNSMELSENSLDKDSSLSNSWGLACIYDKIGDVYFIEKQTDKAFTYFKKALTKFKVLRELDPASIVYARDLSICSNKIGNVYFNNEQFEKAVTYYQDSLKIREELHKNNPDFEEYIVKLFYSFQKLGETFYKKGAALDALDYYEKAVSLAGLLHERSPENINFARSLSKTLDDIGNIFMASKLNKDAIIYWEESIKIALESWKKHPTSEQCAQELFVGYQFLGDFFKQSGDFQLALDYYTKAIKTVGEIQNAGLDFKRYTGNMISINKSEIEIRKGLFEDDPNSIRNAIALSTSYQNIGHIYLGEADVENGQNFYELAINTGLNIYRQFPKSFECANYLSSMYEAMGDVIKGVLRDVDSALLMYQESIAIKEDILKLDFDSSENARDLWKAYHRVGDIYQSLNNIDSADIYYGNALYIDEMFREQDPESSDAVGHYISSCFKMKKLEELTDALNYMKSKNMPMNSWLLGLCEKVGV